MLKILLLRHGQSVGNVEDRYCGMYNCLLSENGKEQGKLACDYIFKNYNVKAIYASELMRAQQTSEPLCAMTNIEKVILPEFNELYGGEWEGVSVCEIAAKYEKDFSIWRNNIGNCTPTGGETWQTALKRVEAGLDKLLKKHSEEFSVEGEKESVIVVVTHGALVKLISTIYSGKTLEEMQDVPFAPNCSLTSLEYIDNKFQITKIGFADYLGDNVTIVGKYFQK